MGRQVKRAVIFCWSESDRKPFDITEDDYIICADSGFRYAERLGIKPDLLLGDFDSYSAKGDESENIITLPTEKDDTDAMYAARCAIEKGFEEIVLAGGIGGREDHTKGAVSVLKFIRKKCRGFISDGYTTVNIVKNGETLVIPYDENIRYISIFPCGERTCGVTLKDMKYEIENYTVNAYYPIGVSNEQLKNKDSRITCGRGGLEVYTIYG